MGIWKGGCLVPRFPGICTEHVTIVHVLQELRDSLRGPGVFGSVTAQSSMRGYNTRTSNFLSSRVVSLEHRFH